MVPMADGTRLAIDIYRPDAPGKFPALVERTPYDKTKSSEIQVGAHTYFAERGYVFLVQDTRGRFASEGTFYPFLDDGWLRNRDGYDTVQWIAQQPWSDGKVGVLGGSYTGQTAYMIAPTQPAALRAMFVRESASDLFDHWVYRGGAFELGFLADLVHAHLRSRYRHARRRCRRRRKRQAAASTRRSRVRTRISGICRSTPIRRCAGRRAGSTSTTGLDHNQDGPYWWQQNVGMQHPRFQVPVYHLGGWYDIFLKGTIENYLGPARARRHRPGARQPEARDRPVGPRPDQRRQGGGGRTEVSRRGPVRFQRYPAEVVRSLAERHRHRRHARAADPDLRDGRQRLAHGDRVAAGPRALHALLSARAASAGAGGHRSTTDAFPASPRRRGGYRELRLRSARPGAHARRQHALHRRAARPISARPMRRSSPSPASRCRRISKSPAR